MVSPTLPHPPGPVTGLVRDPGGGRTAVGRPTPGVRSALARVLPMPRLLVVHHSPTRSVQDLLASLLDGARHPDVEGVEVAVRPALEATADDVLAADGYLLVTPANFGYMSGALKHFFDSTFLAVGGALADDGSAGEGSGDGTARRPFGLLVHGRYDVAGAVRSVLAITGALDWRQAAATVEVLGEVDEADRDRATDLGGTLAALLMPDA